MGDLAAPTCGGFDRPDTGHVSDVDDLIAEPAHGAEGSVILMEQGLLAPGSELQGPDRLTAHVAEDRLAVGSVGDEVPVRAPDGGSSPIEDDRPFALTLT